MDHAAKTSSKHALALPLLNIFFTNEEISDFLQQKKCFKPLDDKKINQLKEFVFIIIYFFIIRLFSLLDLQLRFKIKEKFGKKFLKKSKLSAGLFDLKTP